MAALRLNKFLAARLGVSRREADDAIAASEVTVNGEPAQLGQKVDKNDKVCYNGSIVPFPMDFAYLLFHKPAHYVCSRRAQGETPTIYDILPEEFRSLKSVGRLDKESSGLIILTNDGDFAFRMTHPSFAKMKEYQVELDMPLEPLHQQMITDYGVEIGDGVSKLGLTREDEERRKWLVSMSEGRNRQIRRTFAALGYRVVRLHRVSFGPYRLGDLAEGEWRVFEP